MPFLAGRTITDQQQRLYAITDEGAGGSRCRLAASDVGWGSESVRSAGHGTIDQRFLLAMSNSFGRRSQIADLNRKTIEMRTAKGFAMSDSMLYNVIFAWKCSSTHHKLAMDALRHLRGDQAEAWRSLFLTNVQTYLDGSKAPDNKIKDFRNHVLHVGENLWGGAITAASTWYDKTVAAFREKKWAEGIYNAGVLSHYYTDPIQPFHTGQCEAEQVVHRAAEWSIACSYDELQQILVKDQGGYPSLECPDSDNWLAEMVEAGARMAHPHYQACIDHYDLAKGVKKPPEGMDQDMKDRIAKLIGHAVIGTSRILEAVFEDAEATPPKTSLTLPGILAQLTIPIFFVTKKMTNMQERKQVEAMFQEFQQTGKVIKTATEDDRTLRAIHAEEVLKKPLEELDQIPAGPIGQAHGTGAPARAKTVVKAVAKPAVPEVVAAKPMPAKPMPVKATPVTAKSPSLKFHLELADPVVDAPSIGPKVADRLKVFGVKTVSDLLDSDPEALAGRLAESRFNKGTIVAWQTQAKLVCQVPNLRGHDAQILEACGVENPQQLSASKPDDLLELVLEFTESSEGQRVLRDSPAPDAEEVREWISWSRQSRQLRAA